MRVLIFGDSITYGAWDSEGGGWVTRLTKNVELKDSDFEIFNMSVSGDNTEDLLKRFENECEAKGKPERIVIAIGINDSQYVKSKKRNRVDLKSFERNLNKLIFLSKKFTKDIIFIGLTRVDESKTIPVSWNLDKEYHNKDIIKYDSSIKKIAKNNNLKYIYLFGLLDKEDLYDGLHPNSKGHKLIFEKINKELKLGDF